MARLRTFGFETNSITAGVEWDIMGVGGTGSVVTTNARTGTYCGQISTLASGSDSGFNTQFITAAGNGPFYARFYFLVTTLPTADNTIFRFTNTAFGTAELQVRLSSTGTLKLFYRLSAVQTQIGSASNPLTTGQWYCIEVKFDKSGGAAANVAELKIDGVVVATASNITIDAGVLGMTFGGNLQGEAQTQALWFFDDCAINDSSGSFQNSYPGSGKVLRLLPNAAGDVNTFATQTGGTAGSANNFTRVSEVTPDDATTLNGSNTLNQEDLFNLGNTGLSLLDKINVVHVEARFRNNIADATTAITFEAEKAAAGTKSSSSAIIPNSTAFKTNTIAVPNTPPLTLYQDPNSLDWNQSTLDAMQAGYKLTTGGTNRIEITSIWATVDYTPAIRSKIVAINQAVKRSTNY